MSTTTTIPETVGSYRLDALTETAQSAKATAALLRTMLRQSTGHRYSITVGRGTASDHIYISEGSVADETERSLKRGRLARALDRDRLSGHPLEILIGRNARLRALCLVAGARLSDDWLDIAAPPRDWGWD